MWQFKNFVPYRDRPLCFFDLETTGTKPGKHEIIEVAFRHEKLGILTMQIKPERLDDADPEALKVAGYNYADWIDAPTFKQAAPRITEFFSDATLIGHNIALFDIPIAIGQYEMCELSHDGLFRDVIDTMSLARTFLVPEGLKLLSMKSCRKFFGKEYEGAHSAYEDTVFAEELYRDIIERLRWFGKRDGKKIQESLF